MELIKIVNILIRFLIELCVIGILGYWGFHIGKEYFLKMLFGIGIPLLVIIIWGLFGSPAAPLQLTGFAKILLEILIFGSAIAALVHTGNIRVSILLGIVIILNSVLMMVWKQ